MILSLAALSHSLRTNLEILAIRYQCLNLLFFTHHMAGWFPALAKRIFCFRLKKNRELSVSYLGQTPQKQVFLQAYRVKVYNLVLRLAYFLQVIFINLISQFLVEAHRYVCVCVGGHCFASNNFKPSLIFYQVSNCVTIKTFSGWMPNMVASYLSLSFSITRRIYMNYAHESSYVP